MPLPPQPSQLSRAARRGIARTAAARAVIDQAIAGVHVEAGPPELGPARNLDAEDARRRYWDRQRDYWELPR